MQGPELEEICSTGKILNCLGGHLDFFQLNSTNITRNTHSTTYRNWYTTYNLLILLTITYNILALLKKTGITSCTNSTNKANSTYYYLQLLTPLQLDSYKLIKSNFWGQMCGMT